MKIFEFVKSCYELLNKNKKSFWLMSIIKIISLILSLIITFYITNIITLFSTEDYKEVRKNIIILVMIYIISLICQYIQFTLIQKVEKDTRIETKKMILRRIIKSYLQVYREKKSINSAKINEILYTDANNVTTLLFSILDLCITSFTVIITGILLFLLNFSLTFLLTIFCVMIAIFVFHYSKNLKKINFKLREENDEHFKLIRDIIRNMKYICVSNTGEFHYKRYAKNLDDVKESTIYRDKKAWKLGYWNSIFEYVWIIIFLCYNIGNLSNGNFSISYFMLYFSYSRMYSSGIDRILFQYSNLQQIIVSMERLFGLLKIYNIKEKLKQEFPEKIENITIKNIDFSYDKNKVILSLNRKIEGKCILITGKNGVGKTTLLNLLSGLLVSKKGTVLYNNVPIEDIAIDRLYEFISYGIQGDMVFDISIKDNILSFPNGGNVSSEELKTICKKVGILDDILALDNKFDTQISEIRDLSFGQKKKILLARVFIKPSKIIFLDEPLEGLDIESQNSVINYIKQMSRTKYIFISTHKPEKFDFVEENISL